MNKTESERMEYDSPHGNGSKIGTPRDCPFWNSCSAPVCPVDKAKENMIWYSEEEICINRSFSNLQFIITQKKIKKKHPDGYFTFKMLNRDIIVKKINGVEADPPEYIERRGEEAVRKWYEKRETNWLSIHREVSRQYKENLRNMGIKLKSSEKKKHTDSLSDLNKNNLVPSGIPEVSSSGHINYTAEYNTPKKVRETNTSSTISY